MFHVNYNLIVIVLALLNLIVSVHCLYLMDVLLTMVIIIEYYDNYFDELYKDLPLYYMLKNDMKI